MYLPVLYGYSRAIWSIIWPVFRKYCHCMEVASASSAVPAFLSGPLLLNVSTSKAPLTEYSVRYVRPHGSVIFARSMPLAAKMAFNSASFLGYRASLS